jgi:ribosomal protein S18 acetylase RimI-like enzyme
LLDYVLNTLVAKEHPEVTQVSLHVQVSNTAAIRFYKNNGFEQGEEVKGARAVA